MFGFLYAAAALSAVGAAIGFFQPSPFGYLWFAQGLAGVAFFAGIGRLVELSEMMHQNLYTIAQCQDFFRREAHRAAKKAP